MSKIPNVSDRSTFYVSSALKWGIIHALSAVVYSVFFIKFHQIIRSFGLTGILVEQGLNVLYYGTVFFVCFYFFNTGLKEIWKRQLVRPLSSRICLKWISIFVLIYFVVIGSFKLIHTTNNLERMGFTEEALSSHEMLWLVFFPVLLSLFFSSLALFVEGLLVRLYLERNRPPS